MHITTPLGPFTVPGSLRSDRNGQVQYCYRQLGLRYDPKLGGILTLKVTLGDEGTVRDVVVTKRTWQGISAGEVEACIRALIRDWRFAASDAGADGTTELNYTLSP